MNLLSRFHALTVCTIICLGAVAPLTAGVGPDGGIVVANRGSGSISVIDVATNGVMTYLLPAGNNTPEPMYVVHSPNNNTVFVGDRANDRVVAFDAMTFAVNDTIPTGAGIFHMWGEPSTGALWVNNDIDKSVTRINMNNYGVMGTFPTPADLNQMGGKPHDVTLDPNGPYGYVSMVGFSGASDYVLKFDISGNELERKAVGKDPHLSLSAAHNKLYVPTQGANEVAILDRANLGLLDSVGVPNAHGATHNAAGSVFWTTNIGGGGTDALFAIDTATDMVIGKVSTPFGVPHNLALSPDEKLMYITHSGGASDKVSIVDVSDPENPVYLMSVTTGFNPFGIATIPEPSTLWLGLVGVAGLLRRR